MLHLKIKKVASSSREAVRKSGEVRCVSPWQPSPTQGAAARRPEAPWAQQDPVARPVSSNLG